MRVESNNSHLSVRVIASAEVISFGLNIPDDKAEGLLGLKKNLEVHGNSYMTAASLKIRILP
ncbi:MAG: hypothetical protein JKY54_13610 [Flavobacteriales bacterium]|nr:hypothetical protein [Flavobacteriales bacterium]